ncbi:UNVERIFIED_CONTAM: hypothetical protein Sradi_5227200 [Sesamum radiatum]|uniref:Uncharacterized protein n=1 Tax=Sesamum radiatum TaxID=300843 RepID=A0AAW2LLS7_SESRA
MATAMAPPATASNLRNPATEPTSNGVRNPATPANVSDARNWANNNHKIKAAIQQ